MGRRFAAVFTLGVLMVGLCLVLPGCKKTVQAPPIKIGAIFAVTGPAANLGGPEEKTAKMFVEKLNAAGGINGQKIELLIKDSGASPEKAISLAKQLIEEEKVLAIIGPSTSGETMAIKNLCQENQTHPRVLRRRRGYCQSPGQLRLQDSSEGQPGRRVDLQYDEEARHQEDRRHHQQHGFRKGWKGSVGETGPRRRNRSRDQRSL